MRCSARRRWQVIMQMYSEPLQKFRLAGQGLYDGPQPSSPTDRERLAKYFDPLAVLVRAAGKCATVARQSIRCTRSPSVR